MIDPQGSSLPPTCGRNGLSMYWDVVGGIRYKVENWEIIRNKDFRLFNFCFTVCIVICPLKSGTHERVNLFRYRKFEYIVVASHLKRILLRKYQELCERR